ncbi:EsV-1-27 [Ectocarpus siliculosus]|uniref:EsV-1-27 n=1 Tax=Ectocarpus siliculosus TaxID=2880 RepID=D8LP64_ECTSI|nr:EsV-1-27 [Ectocarpus siliculosus]|eukprot:CBN80335.1 EsV-1-27 [Ectocarpus siliculosus]
MTLLRSLASTVSFVGETTINTLSFIRETVFSILTFVVQTVTSTVLFILSQLVSVWRLVVVIITATLGETCYLATNGIDRVFDFFSDYMLSLQAFRSGLPGLAKVLKAQVDDVKTGVNVTNINLRKP